MIVYSKRRDSFAKLPKLLIKRWSVEISQVGNSSRVKYREVLNFRGVGGGEGEYRGNLAARSSQRIKSPLLPSRPRLLRMGGSYRKYVKNLGLGHFH